MAATHPTTFPFLLLPRELRDQIYALTLPTRTSLHPLSHQQSPHHTTPLPPSPLPLTSRLLHTETLQHLYATNTLTLRLHAITLSPTERLLAGITSPQFYTNIFAWTTTLHIKFRWLFADDAEPTPWHMQASTGWYSRCDVEKLKAKVGSIARALSKSGPDMLETVVLEFPPLIYSRNHKLEECLTHVIDTGLADVLREIGRMRTLRVTFRRYRSYEYMLYLGTRGEVPFEAYEASLEMAVGLLVYGSGSVVEDAERAMVAVRVGVEGGRM